MKRILIVEDDRRLSDELGARLSGLGYEVAACPSSRHALEEARRFRAEMVLLDVMLGDGLGYEVARSIRRDSLLYRVPVLFESAVGDGVEVAHALTQGGDGYLCKPFSMGQMQDQLERMKHLELSIEKRCPVTNFRTMPRLHREVDHKLFRDESFALCYIFMKGLPIYSRAKLHRQVEQITVTTAEAIRSTIQNDGFCETCACHIGGGYFMVLLKHEDHERFRKCVRARFAVRRESVAAPSTKEATSSNGVATATTSDVKDAARYSLMVGVTHTGRRRFRHAEEMFEVLRKMDVKVREKQKKFTKASGHNHWV